MVHQGIDHGQMIGINGQDQRGMARGVGVTTIDVDFLSAYKVSDDQKVTPISQG